MNSARDREIAIFNGALQLPADQRAAYLEMACVDDAQLRKRVEALLRAHEAAENFLKAQPVKAYDPPAAAAHPKPVGTLRVAPASSEKEGDRIGRYRVLQEIGEGGCGAVYMAEQEEPVRRRVALKVIKLGMDTRQVIARFEAERQALALMDHPNIAKVLDAGATETGRPFFVMELVRGIKITEYCDQHKLPTRQRLELFIQICQAIQHAHQKGIIHRDIKPSNILVTLHDGVPVPKVIDFGIAKATTDVHLTDKTVFTRFEQFIGTPAYMSPEQAEMSGLDIDTRTDIYSLGVLLYELLTGKTPFDAKELQAVGLEQMRRTIREREPVRPSTRVGALTGDDLTTTASRRALEAPRLVSLLRGDLDWIVMKALEKDRTRRYETANGLAFEVKRFLNNEPVLARPPSKLYRLQKLARRNKTAFAATTTVFIALLAGLGVSTWMFAQERVARHRALAAEKEQDRLRQVADAARQKAEADDKRARTEARKSQQVATFLKQMLEGVDPDEALGADTVLLRKILDRTVARIGTELKDQPEVEAQLRETLGRVYCDLGEYGPAEEMLRQALRLQDAVSGEESTNSARLLNLLGEVLWDAKQYVAAEATQRKALALSRKLFGDISSEVSVSLSDLALVVHDRGDQVGAEKLWLEAIEIRTKLPEHEKEVRAHQIDAADALDNYAGLLIDWGKAEPAIPFHRQALELREKWCGPDSPKVAVSLNNLALTLRQAGKLVEAEELARRVLKLSSKLWGNQHWHIPIARKNLGIILRRGGALSGDLGPLREALSLNPLDQLTADALAAASAKPSLTPLMPGWPSQPLPWQYTYDSPGAEWAAPDFPDALWPTAPAPRGSTLVLPRTNRTPPPIATTNLWLRRQFELAEAPASKVVLIINQNHDATVFVNGVQAAPPADWSDTQTLVPCSEAGQRALKKGRNVLAVHCQDADGGTAIEVGICVTQDESLGRKRLIEEFTPMIQQEPQRADLFAGRASALARLGRWREAVTNLQQAIELKPAAALYQQLAPILLEAGDASAYRRLLREAFDRFAKSPDPDETEAVCKLSLLAPAQGVELEETMKLAEQSDAIDDRQVTLALRQQLRGLSEFRRGRFAGALEWADKTLATTTRKDLPGWNHERERNRGATAHFTRAMAYHHLKQTEAARGALAAGTQLVQKQFPTVDSGDVGREWPDWLIAHILQREAKALIEGTAATATESRP